MTNNRFIRTKMKEQDPKERRYNFDEVPFGYTEEEAVLEASRCLQCKNPPCVEGCPVNVQIPQFLSLIKERKFSEAAKKIKETNSLPAICGRVCPQESQCEGNCVLNKKGVPIAIGNLERFAADWERENSKIELPEIGKKNGKKVAVVGSGPAGLSAASDLAKAGFNVTIFEALHEAGGVLMYGIPEFRLPKKIVKEEISYLEKMGVKIEKNIVIGKTIEISELFEDEGFDAVFIGAGAGLPRFMGIKGENSIGVYSANEFLTRVNLMKAYKEDSETPVLHGKTIVTVGGGNVAMDSARTALRIGAENSIVVYRRSENEMPARNAEIHHAKEEGVQFNFLTNPIEILYDEKNRVTGIKCIKMELGEPDESGRRRPVPIEGSEFEIPCDVVIIAIGNKPNPLITSTTKELKTTRWGTIDADEKTGKTSMPYVYAGGDIVTGAATVILAMGAGKIAAKEIGKDLLK